MPYDPLSAPSKWESVVIKCAICPFRLVRGDQGEGQGHYRRTLDRTIGAVLTHMRRKHHLTRIIVEFKVPK
jgi:hypothetical protein